MSDQRATTTFRPVPHERGTRPASLPPTGRPGVLPESRALLAVSHELGARDREDFSEGAPQNAEQELLQRLAEFKAGLSDWGIGEFDLSLEHRRAVQWIRWFREDELIPYQWKGLSIEFPEHIYLTFDPGPANQLGFYEFGRSLAHGLRHRINLNPVAMQLLRRSTAQTASVLLHECLHLCQELYMDRIGRRIRRGSYHSVEFRRRAELLGTPCTLDGRELGVVPDGPFDKWLDRHRIPRVHEYTEDEASAAKPGLPKRLSWRCRCPRGVSVHVPRGHSLNAVCLDCEARFEPATTWAESMLRARTE